MIEERGIHNFVSRAPKNPGIDMSGASLEANLAIGDTSVY
jgi:hypothetical protein